MKKIFFIILFLISISFYSYSLGLTYGPLANEQYLIENEGQFPASFYGFPLFLGGIYHKINFSNKIFYYIDLTFNIHNSRTFYFSTDIINTNSYLFYLHNDINYYPFRQNWIYVGTGIELIAIYRKFSNEVAEYIGYNYYVTTNYFCYINIGLNIPIGKAEIGFKMLYRLLPFYIDNKIGNGELAFLIGLK
jgi:hypothetical protein